MSIHPPAENVAKVNPVIGTVAAVNTRAVTAERNERARTFIRRVVERDYASNQAAAAKAFGVTPSLLSEFLGGTRGAGMKFLEGVSRVTGATIDEITGRPDRASSSARPVLGSLQGWEDAEAQARAILKSTPDWVFTCARNLSGLKLPPVADVELVMRAVDLARQMPPPGEDTPETVAAKREVERIKREAGGARPKKKR